MSEATDAIEAALSKPKRARKGQDEVEQHSVGDLIKAHQYLAEREAAAESVTSLPVAFGRTVPPGAV